jgi:hypothetical protein
MRGDMQRLAIIVTLLVTPMQLQAQTTRVEADHVFVMVQAFGPVEAAALEQLGFTAAGWARRLA